MGFCIIRNACEYCLLIQKWPYQVLENKKRNIQNYFIELINFGSREHIHRKPYKMTRTLIKQLSNEGDLVVDPCAGSFVSLTACNSLKRDFVGTDLEYFEILKFNINKENSRRLLNLVPK